MAKEYCDDILNRKRFETRVVHVGNVELGGDNPIRVQSMTTTDTMDTEGSVAESIRMIKAGCEIVRLTAPSKKDAENLKNIKDELVSRGYDTPLVADIHFTPNAAEIAANIVEKVRVNPGNYADKKRFEEIDFTDESYNAELARIEEKFTPLVLQCKANNVAMRIGTNHGSLSDRILSRYGDTPEGMVESAMEFLRICIKHDYHEIVLSMKASNTIVMVEAYRLLVAEMREHGMNYPLHLGVTEAGDGEDGRIKSAVGIGALLEDGIGDTIRVSLTEAPEAEIPVAKKLLDKYNHVSRNELSLEHPRDEVVVYTPFSYSKREATESIGIGGHHHPVVIGDVSNLTELKPANLFGFGYQYSVPNDKWNIQDQAVDILYVGGNTISFEKPGGLIIMSDYNNWSTNYRDIDGFYPILDLGDISKLDKDDVFFIRVRAEEKNLEILTNYPNAIIVCESQYDNKTHLFRLFSLNIAKLNINNPVILKTTIDRKDPEEFQLWSAPDLGTSLLDGFGNGIWLTGPQPAQLITSTSFGILQATRTRISKTEYISCPSCGRTLFDLQETTAKIREHTSHLKGLKIGVMGCIVNGPGEMADADYGYVGTGPGKIHLYKEKTVVKKNVPESEAVAALIDLIKENGDWVEKPV